MHAELDANKWLPEAGRGQLLLTPDTADEVDAVLAWLQTHGAGIVFRMQEFDIALHRTEGPDACKPERDATAKRRKNVGSHG